MDPDRHEEIARCLFRESNDALLLFDPRDHRVVGVNTTALRLTGFERPRLLELRVWDLFSSIEPNGVERLSQAYLQTGLFHSREGYYLCRDADAPIPVNISVSRIHTKPDPLGLVVARDISERVHAAEALRESEERYRTLVESAGVIIWSLSSDGMIATLNPAFESITGWSRDDWFGRSFVALVHPDDATRAEELFGRALGGEALSTFELRLRARDGGERNVELISTRRVVTRERVEVVGIARDVTEVRRAEQAIRLSESLRRAKETAEVAIRTKSQFLANVSHEIRTPMTAILGLTDLLLGAEAEPDQQRRHLLAIKQNGTFLVDLLSDLLNLTKAEIGTLSVESAACAPDRIVDEVVAALWPRGEARGLALDVRYTTPIPTEFPTDSIRLRQILMNLFSNAIKYTERGEVRLWVSFDEVEPALRFDVSDTGIGLSADEQARIFEPFYQARLDAADGPSGSGLGLAISKRLAETLGGRIKVCSEPGQGSTFSLILPTGPLSDVPRRTRGPSETANAAQESRTGRPYAVLPPGTRILLAEDNDANREVISLMLRRTDAEVVVSSNGQEAIDRAVAARDAGRPFDVLLMDMQMPILDGYAATRELRNLGFRQPIVALTAYAGDDSREECLRFGCDEHVSKPIDWEKLFETIRRHMARHAGASDGPLLIGSASG
jgi:PAS domain S-box-containing protein